MNELAEFALIAACQDAIKSCEKNVEHCGFLAFSETKLNQSAKDYFLTEQEKYIEAVNQLRNLQSTVKTYQALRQNTPTQPKEMGSDEKETSNG